MSELKNYNYRIDEKNISVAVISLHKNVIGGTDALSFTKVLEDISSKPEIKCVITDLSEVDIMNSSGLGMLISGHTMLKKFNICMYLINVPEKVKNLLNVTHLNKVFTIYDNYEDAISHCK